MFYLCFIDVVMIGGAVFSTTNIGIPVSLPHADVIHFRSNNIESIIIVIPSIQAWVDSIL